MYTLIEIAYAISQQNAEATIAHYFKETGNLLIGHSIFEETGEVLLVVLLMHPHKSEYTDYLKNLLLQGIVESFEYRFHYLVIVTLDSHLDIRMQMQDFPLQPGESWFPAVDHPDQVYICLERYLMTAEQAAWMLKHQVGWAYYQEKT